MKRARVKMLKPAIRTIDTRTAKPPPKVANPYYLSPEHRAWRAEVIRRAGGRCEFMVIPERRCARALPADRMFADHKVELSDGGNPFDPANGQCLCGAHHILKTNAARAERLGRAGG